MINCDQPRTAVNTSSYHYQIRIKYTEPCDVIKYRYCSPLVVAHMLPVSSLVLLYVEMFWPNLYHIYIIIHCEVNSLKTDGSEYLRHHHTRRASHPQHRQRRRSVHRWPCCLASRTPLGVTSQDSQRTTNRGSYSRSSGRVYMDPFPGLSSLLAGSCSRTTGTETGFFHSHRRHFLESGVGDGDYHDPEPSSYFSLFLLSFTSSTTPIRPRGPRLAILVRNCTPLLRSGSQ